MNPQTTWEQLLAAFAAGAWDAIEEHAQELLYWLERGGVPPKVTHRIDLGADFDRALVEAGCHFALDTLRGEWTIPQ